MLKFNKYKKSNYEWHTAQADGDTYYQICKSAYGYEVALCQGVHSNGVTPLKREVFGYGTFGACKKHAENHYLKRRGILKRKAVREQRHGMAAGCLAYEDVRLPYPRED